jgi:RNase adaptor protein for sRNA GlmZ degradation
MQLFLISGLSGSGKSVALKALEDSGYYCVDKFTLCIVARPHGKPASNR